MLNVRDESRRAVIDNEEIKNLVQILGLKYDKLSEGQCVGSIQSIKMFPPYVMVSW